MSLGSSDPVRIVMHLMHAREVKARKKRLKPGSHKHKIDTKTKHDLSSGTCKYKTTRIFLCFVYCSALGLCFDCVLMLVLMSLYMSQASLHSFVLPFVCP